MSGVQMEQQMASHKLNGNPYGQGSPVSQEALGPVMQHVKRLREAHARKRVAAFVANAKARYGAGENLAKASRYLGIDLKHLKDMVASGDRKTEPKALFSLDAARHHAGPQKRPTGLIKPLSWTGSGGGVRSAPYDYWDAFDSITEGAGGWNGASVPANAAVDPQAQADFSTGYIEAGAGSSTVSSSTVLSKRSIGIYVSPPNAGLLTFSATTVLQGWGASEVQGFGGTSWVLVSVYPEIWQIPNGESFSAGGPSLFNGFDESGWQIFFQNEGNIFSQDYSQVSGSGFSSSTLTFGAFTQGSFDDTNPLSSAPGPQIVSISTVYPVDTEHYYILWVSDVCEVSAEGYNQVGHLWGARAGACAGAWVLNMSWSLTP
jgi:hypothetical protein